MIVKEKVVEEVRKKNDIYQYGYIVLGLGVLVSVVLSYCLGVLYHYSGLCECGKLEMGKKGIGNGN